MTIIDILNVISEMEENEARSFLQEIGYSDKSAETMLAYLEIKNAVTV